jgi:hypothetical protein
MPLGFRNLVLRFLTMFRHGFPDTVSVLLVFGFNKFFVVVSLSALSTALVDEQRALLGLALWFSIWLDSLVSRCGCAYGFP